MKQINKNSVSLYQSRKEHLHLPSIRRTEKIGGIFLLCEFIGEGTFYAILKEPLRKRAALHTSLTFN
jgi:hypothetical protein